uniref:Uncharacterized protein n=1 Tax=Amphimedon queenslandica TaxID=400682 RepID=A0A1X7TY88_AMPQE
CDEWTDFQCSELSDKDKLPENCVKIVDIINVL